MAKLISLLVFLATATPFVVSQTVLTPGLCPTYQTTKFFTSYQIAEITKQQGYTVLMQAGTDAEQGLSCMRLRLLENNNYKLQYVDAAQNIVRVEGGYTAQPSGYLNPGSLRLTGLNPGILGADVFGTTTLYPLIMGSDREVFISCTSYGLTYTESVYVMAPYWASPVSLKVDETHEYLKTSKVPRAKALKVVDQSCASFNIVRDASAV